MDNLPLFSTLEFPEKKGVKIKDFQYVVVEGDTRIYYLVDKRDSRLGFMFYITEFFSRSCGDKEFENPYDDPTFEASCLFWGYASWDGLRHLYMGDKVTDTENYLYYAESVNLSLVFAKLRDLEKDHCSLNEIRGCDHDKRLDEYCEPCGRVNGG